MYSKIQEKLYTFLHDEQAATAIEYSIMLVLIVLVVLATVAILGHKTANSYNEFNNRFNPGS
jgi:Flp pilus assembly pilin Flp